MARPTALLALVPLALGACDPSYEFAPIPVGQHAERVPRPRTNGQYLRAVYADVVGRAPADYNFVVTDPGGQELARLPIDEQAMLLRFLDGVGDPAPLRDLIAAGLVDSAEVKLPAKAAVADPAAFVTDQFRLLLGREPGAYELAAFVNGWKQDPAVNPRTVIRALVGSREYQSY